MKNLLALLPVVATLLIIATPAFAGITQTPEPSTVFLIGGGLGALILFDRYRRAKKK
jgi:PEP-CTERM motif-containing protein